MRMEAEFIERLKARGLEDAEIQSSLERVDALGEALACRNFSLEKPSLEIVEAWISGMTGGGEPAAELLLSLARYFALTRETALAIRLLAYLSPIGILPSMSGRLASLEGGAVRDRVMGRLAIPPEGSPPEAYPAAPAGFHLNQASGSCSRRPSRRFCGPTPRKRLKARSVMS